MIAVVGGSGFVGTRLCQRFARAGTPFLIVDKAPSFDFPAQWIQADVRDIDSLRLAIPPAATIVNLAAEHRDDVRPQSLYSEVNVDGAANLVTVATEKGIDKIVFTSSVACYGFAPANTDESGRLDPFNEYGRTKALAEGIFREWQQNDSVARSLLIVRPTVIFGERNRGNVYNLLRQIAEGKFVMIGDGKNRKSMAYVENVAAFLEHSVSFGPGMRLFNYCDKPDFDMNTLVSQVRRKLGRKEGVGLRIPYSAGYAAGLVFDLVARVTGKRLPISSIRVKKFCAVTQFASAVDKTEFIPPCTLLDGLERTVSYEFLETTHAGPVFFSE